MCPNANHFFTLPSIRIRKRLFFLVLHCQKNVKRKFSVTYKERIAAQEAIIEVKYAMSFEENNNESIVNCTNNNNYATKIRKENDETKINFIKDVKEKADIPTNFTVLRNTNINKIFFYGQNGEKRRDYIFIENNKFYCTYCLCFSAMDTNSFIQGVEYVRGGRMPEKLQKHEISAHHQSAQRVFVEKSSNSIREQQNVKRSALKSIFKIIIFLATHGKDKKINKFRPA